MSAPLATVLGVLLGGGATAALALVWMAARRRRFAAVPLGALVACCALLALTAQARVRTAGVEACAAELQRLGSALDLYEQSHEGEAPATLETLVPFYFAALPGCPEAERAGQPDPYLSGYESRDGVFTVVCRGAHHRGLGGAPADFPRFTSAAGVQTVP